MTKYEGIVYWSGEDDAFVAELPELPGCAAHGPRKPVRRRPSSTSRVSRLVCQT